MQLTFNESRNGTKKYFLLTIETTYSANNLKIFLKLEAKRIPLMAQESPLKLTNAKESATPITVYQLEIVKA